MTTWVAPDEAAEFVDLYDPEVKSAAAVAEECKRHPKTVLRHLKERGVTVKANRRNPDREQKMIAFYNTDKSLRQVAAEFNCSYGTAHKVISEAGIMRARGGSARKKIAA